MIPSHMIVIWKVRIPRFNAEEERFRTLLSSKETKKADAFRSKELTRRYVITQGILRCILGKYLVIAPEEVEFTLGPHQKPYVARDSSKLQFNMTHSGDLALIAISTSDEVGIDIERCDPNFLDEGLEKSVLSEYEREAYAKVPAQLKTEAFFCAWTHKEALLKLAGVGLYKAPKDVEVPLHLVPDTCSVLFDGQERFLKSFLVDNGYVAAVASTKPYFDISVRAYGDHGSQV